MTGFVAPDFDNEPIPGLPGMLPVGETIVWQGKPETNEVWVHVFKARWIAAYFAAMLGWLLVTGLYFGRGSDDIIMSLIIMAAAGAAVLGIFRAFAAGVHRTTVYTITNRRVVMRIGIALPTAFNLPFCEMESADVLKRANGSGNIALRFKPDIRLNWAVFFPHVRGLKMSRTEPQMIGLADVVTAADILALQLHADIARRHTDAMPTAHDVTPNLAVIGPDTFQQAAE